MRTQRFIGWACAGLLGVGMAQAQVVVPTKSGVAMGPMKLDGVWEAVTPGMQAVVVLAQRGDGRLVGYLPGSLGSRVLGGRVRGRRVHFLIGDHEGGIWHGEFVGAVAGTKLAGEIHSGGAATPVEFQLTTQLGLEESWLLFEGDYDERLRMSRVEDATGAFALGGFENLGRCDFVACGGQITSWVQTGLNHTIQTSSSGSAGCPMVTDLVGTQDPSEYFLMGTYATSDCTGSLASGSFMGGKLGFTFMDDAEDVVQALAQFADAFENEDAAAADLFHSAYLYNGTSRADWQAMFASWWGQYDGIKLDLSVDQIVMEQDYEVHAYLAGPARMNLHLQAAGRNVTTGAWEGFWSSQTTLPGGGELSLLGREAGRIVLVGNGESQPFRMGLPITPAEFANSTYGIWPFGVHGGGHPEGHPGIDFEYAAGAKVLATCDGPVVVIMQNTSHLPTVLWSVVQEPRPGLKVIYDEIENLDASIVLGNVIMEGGVIGDPYDKTTFRSNHLGLMVHGELLCPSDFWHASAQTQIDALWPLCFYSQEPVEPRMHSDYAARMPLTSRWERRTSGSGSSAAQVQFTRLDATTNDYDYALLDSAGATTEWGQVNFNMAYPFGTLKFVPDASLGLGDRYGVYDIVEDVLTLDWDGAGTPSDLLGASVYDLALD